MQRFFRMCVNNSWWCVIKLVSFGFYWTLLKFIKRLLDQCSDTVSLIPLISLKAFSVFHSLICGHKINWNDLVLSKPLAIAQLNCQPSKTEFILCNFQQSTPVKKPTHKKTHSCKLNKFTIKLIEKFAFPKSCTPAT